MRRGEPLVAKEWESYLRRVLPYDAPPVQILECRRAFYAGAAALLDIVCKNASEGDEVQDSDMALMLSVQRELSEFGESGGLL